MNQERLFLDTVFIQALLNKNDQYHHQAKALLSRVRNASEVCVTESVLIEVGNALSAVNRTASVQFINQCYQTDNIKVISVDTQLLMRALELYHSRQDKSWGLTDCISFIVMKEQALIYAFEKYELLVREKRVRIGTQDLRIAAIAESVNGILVTRNTQDFEKAYLLLEDWTVKLPT